MCRSSAEGGQRCAGHAAATLVAAETKYDTIAQSAIATLADAGQVPETVRVQCLKAKYKLADARAQYASTPTGSDDLSARADALILNGRPDRVVLAPRFNPATARHDRIEYDNLRVAITRGQRMRNQAQEINHAVTTGTMTPQQAKELTQHRTATNGRIRKLLDEAGMEQWPWIGDQTDHAFNRDVVTRGEALDRTFRNKKANNGVGGGWVTHITHPKPPPPADQQTPTSTGPNTPPPAPAATQLDSVRKPVKYMQVGDRLSSGAIIVTKPSRGIRTPAGKHEIGVKYSNGTTRRATWGSNTLITVTPARTDPPPALPPTPSAARTPPRS
ncbi:hypothetical protein [Tessaracoccus sp.]